MGLATVYGIINQAGGWVEVDSELGVGTTFRIILPASLTTDSSPVEEASGASEGPTLLLVEDEPALRQLVASMLVEGGYNVLQAGNGLDAIGVAEQHAGTIDLLVTDVVMPRLSGPELVHKLQSLRPGLEVLYMSGYNDSRLMSRGVAEGQVRLLVKPFTPNQLLDLVGELTGVPGV